jgi:hypothetical protein
MSRHSLHTLGRILGLFLIATAAPAMAATQPTLYTINTGTPKVLGQGVQKSWPVKINEGNAFDAIFKGGMWLPNPAGGRIYVKYQRHILHDNGTWSWIGTVATVHGDQSVVLTFGKDGVFGLVPQASGYPLRIVTRKGQTSLIETDAQAMSRSAEALRLYSKPDYVIPPPRTKTASETAAVSAPSAANATAQAAASGPATIDVMVVYTPGFVSELGGQNLALTRIQNLVDIANQAYTTSGVNQQIRLVTTAEVNYPDSTGNQSALDDITGIDENGNPVTIPASLQGVASLRAQYGADLVTMIRSFDDSTQQGCGVGWLIGGNQTSIGPQSSVYGYNVVSDGTSVSGDVSYYCLDTTFAHELGHNMGDAHDRANASEAGAYSYSYGYLGNGTKGFSTVMAYGTPTTTPLAVFSNPDISVCQNTPCGVADSASNSADNAHSMNNTATLIAAFEPTKVGTPPPLTNHVHNDVNDDGKSDLLLEYGQNSRFGYWILDGKKLVRTWSMATNSAYRIVATGDFNGDGYLDIVWINSSRQMSMWLGGSSGSFTVGNSLGVLGSGWRIVGAADVNGDGNADLLLEYTGNIVFGYWIMNGSKVVRTWSVATNPDYWLVATGDFNGDGHLDIAWSSAKNDVRLWLGNGTSFATGYPVATYFPGWHVVGAADINGDRKSDLLLQFGNNQSFGYWIMDGQKVVRTWSVVTDPSYRLVEVGDFNGDGYPDVAWTSYRNDVRLWFGNGSTFGMGNPVGIYALGWQMVVDVPNQGTWR